MERETRTLLVAGAVLLVSAAGWSRVRGGTREPPAVNPFTHVARSGTPAVAILFSPQDCGTLIESLRLWNAPNASGRVSVRGYLQLPRGHADELRKVVRGAVLSFPVEPVSAGQAAGFRRALGYRGESLIVLSDTAGRVRHLIPPDNLSSPGARAHALELAESLGAP